MEEQCRNRNCAGESDDLPDGEGESEDERDRRDDCEHRPAEREREPRGPDPAGDPSSRRTQHGRAETEVDQVEEHDPERGAGQRSTSATTTPGDTSVCRAPTRTPRVSVDAP